MSIVINQRPTQTVGGEVSAWNAVGNPIVYKLQRKDFVFNQINNNGGSVQMQFNSVNLLSSFANGDSVYVGSDNGVYGAVGIVTARSFSTNTLITVNIPYSSVAPGGWANNETLRPYYQIQVNLYTPTNVIINLEPFLYTTNTSGYLLLDTSSIIRPTLSPDNDVVLTTYAGLEDANPYKFFKLGYKEIWEGSANSETIDSTEIIAVFGAKQIPSAYGGNMGDYVAYNDGTPIGLFLTKFTSPTMWRGWPFSLSILVDPDVSGNVVFVSPLTGDSTMPSNLTGKMATVVLTDWPLNQIDDPSFTIKLEKDGGGTVLSDELTVKNNDACKNPIMLLARNTLGGHLWWMFDFSQEYTFTYSDGRKAKRLVLFAQNLTLNEWEALQDFITFGEVYRNNIQEFTSLTNKTNSKIGQQVYQVLQDGTKIGVIALPTANQTLTRFNKHSFELEIEYPEIFTA